MTGPEHQRSGRTELDVDAAAARHRPFPGHEAHCQWCDGIWPCDAAQALDVIREREDRRRILEHAVAEKNKCSVAWQDRAEQAADIIDDLITWGDARRVSEGKAWERAFDFLAQRGVPDV